MGKVWHEKLTCTQEGIKQELVAIMEELKSSRYFTSGYCDDIVVELSLFYYLVLFFFLLFMPC